MVVNAVEIANTYTITYDAGEGTVTPATQDVVYDSTPTLEGYTFTGWTYNDNAVLGKWTIADAYLSNELGSGWEWWHNFYEFHKLAIDELEAFDYEEYKKNGFKVNKLGDYDLTLDFDKKPE